MCLPAELPCGAAELPCGVRVVAVRTLGVVACRRSRVVPSAEACGCWVVVGGGCIRAVGVRRRRCVVGGRMVMGGRGLQEPADLRGETVLNAGSGFHPRGPGPAQAYLVVPCRVRCAVFGGMVGVRLRPAVPVCLLHPGARRYVALDTLSKLLGLWVMTHATTVLTYEQKGCCARVIASKVCRVEEWQPGDAEWRCPEPGFQGARWLALVHHRLGTHSLWSLLKCSISLSLLCNRAFVRTLPPLTQPSTGLLS